MELQGKLGEYSEQRVASMLIYVSLALVAWRVEPKRIHYAGAQDRCDVRGTNVEILQVSRGTQE